MKKDMITHKFITTEEAMELVRVKSRSGLKSITDKFNITPLWRCESGNVYNIDDFMSVSKNKKTKDAFSNF